MLRKPIILIILILAHAAVHAQGKTLEFTKKITISDGLAHNGVTAMLHDSKGYLWISTYDGLNRYDGYECKVYKNSLDSNLLVSNRIRTIAEDSDGILWLGTDEGISIYDHSTEKFTIIYSNSLKSTGLKGPIVRKFLMNKTQQKVICATEDEGILVFNSDYTLNKRYLLPKNISPQNVLFHDVVELDSLNYVFATSIGVIHFNLEKGEFFRPFEDESFNGKSIIKTEKNELLITRNWGVGIYRCEKNGEVWNFKLIGTKLNAYSFTCLASDKIGNLWLGTARRGIIHMNSLSSFIANKKNNRSIFRSETGYLRTSYILPTENYGCWVASFDKGLYKFELEENAFKHYSAELKYKNAIKTNEILTISPIDKDRFYVSSLSGGTAIFNTSNAKFSSPSFNLSEVEEGTSGLVFRDSRERLWVRHAGTLGIVNPLTRNIEGIEHDSFPGFSQEVARSMAEDKWGNIWIGTLNDVYKLSINDKGAIKNIENLNKHPLFSNNKVTLARVVYIDPVFDFIWVGTDSDGLIRIKNTQKIKLEDAAVNQYLHKPTDKQTVSSNFVSTIVRLPNKELWIGTERGGINKVENSDTEPFFRAFSAKQGLSNNVVKSIMYDNESNLWISTNIGLNKLNTSDLSFRTFSKQDGLPFEDFLYPSAKLENGTLVFSGMGGFIYFKPEKVHQKESLPMLDFGEISVFNKIVLPGEKVGNKVLFHKRLSEGDELKLKYNQNVFSIELTSLHFSTPENHFLRYRLMPVNTGWLEISSNQRVLQYNGLQPGEYQLEVCASNSLKQWTKPKVLNLTITPPFWKTLPAIVLYAVLLGLLVYATMHYFLSINKLQHKLEIEQLEKKAEKELNAEKLRFFSNISHEIKTPLTLITGPVNLLAERFRSNSDVKEKLQLVQRQSKKISQLVDQVHDFQRSDANLLKMEYSGFCFNDFVHDVLVDFEFLAANEQKIFNIHHPAENIFVSADKKKIEKILNNLLNNAFKYSSKGDSITVSYNKRESDLLIRVKDTGKGIDVDDLPFIFDRFYRSQNQQEKYSEGSGIGLAFSKRLVEMHYGYISAESILNKGAAFIVKLPVIIDKPANFKPLSEQEILEEERKFNPASLVTEKVDPTNINVLKDFSSAKVFIVEDNTDMRTFISGVLSNFFKIKAFSNGKVCLKAMEEEWPELVISDVLMPEMNGFELCKNIKSDIKTSHIPVILLTACTTIDDQLKGLEVGADAYIHKPFNIQHLVTRAETLLKNREKLRERFLLNFPFVLEKKRENNNDLVFLEKLYRLMEENLDNQDLDINSFAKELYLNRTHFFQKVKALTKHTPFELLKVYRLNKAAEFLAKNQYSVNEVYVMTGFKSRTHFSKLFKEKFNTTPGKYVEKVLKEQN